ncbi:MAG: carbohydrate binding domain-containing protein [Clostridia bacterium]|nr:carbohydrate binding domain-containing protein [Clostridia bacterium]
MKITITNKKGVDVNPHMIGLFFEDINYGADGGLYAELLENRSFDFFPTMEFDDISPLAAWSTVGEAEFTSETKSPMNNINPQYAHIKGNAGEGIVNRAYEGIFCENGKKYDFSLYVKGEAKLKAEIRTDEASCGEVSFETKGDWTKYSFEIEASETAYNAKLYLTFEESGECDIDMVSLFPRDTFMGRKNGLRADMAQALKDIKPGFVRFPGGCIVEGTVLENRYRWKDTIGPVEERKINWNRWQDGNVGVTAHDYFQSYGLGFYEYFLLCEDIGAQPLPVLNCGMACQYKTGECAPMDELDEYIQDAIDLIEFANGNPEENKWAAIRAQMGHPEPFNLVYLGIGNEQWEENYFERYEAFQKVIAPLYPDIKLITSSGPFAQGKEFDAAYKWLDGKGQDFAYAVDEHYYVKSEWMFDNANRYDKYSRDGIKVFAGEYACHIGDEQPKPNNLEAAIAEGAMMTGFERNADVVVLASYAPLFARENYTQWRPDMIFVNNHEIMLTPSYHVQAMYGNNLPDYTLLFEREEDNDVYISAGYSEKHGYILKVANRSGKKDVVLSLPEGVDTIEEINLTSENLSDVNTMQDKNRVAPKSLTRPVGGSREVNLTVPPISFNVYKLK